MKRIPFSQVLKNAKVDIRREYERLYELFVLQKHIVNHKNGAITLREVCANNFMSLPFRNTCTSLRDFDESYNFKFSKSPKKVDINYLLSFCEYSCNLAVNNYDSGSGVSEGTKILHRLGYVLNEVINIRSLFNDYVEQVFKVIENIGYMSIHNGVVIEFVPKDQVAISVAEIIDPSLSYRVIEYNHHSMNGDRERKRAVLLAFADKLEPQRSKLREINRSLESALFYLLNNVNIRHNNTDREGKNYHPFVATMSNKDIEDWYDEIYQLCLLAFLEIDNLKRINRIESLKKAINQRKE